jgi:transposase-like protein
VRYKALLPKFNLQQELPLPHYRSRLPNHIIAMALALYSFPLSSRDVTTIIYSLFNRKISHQTIFNLVYSVAHLLQKNINKLPIKNSGIWIVDEKFIKYEGKFGYLFTVLDSTGIPIAHYFSTTRSVKGAFAVMSRACERVKPKDLIIVTDKYLVYPLAIQMISADLGIKIEHISIKGLCGKETHQKRRSIASIKI